MSDRFNRIEIEDLLKWILAEEKQGQIFSISKDLFFTPSREHTFRMKRYGQLLESPLGLAAGPHTQLAQNLVTGWLCGARYMELKTVQTLDEIEVAKPCIDMEDEGYNCEWSQELKIDDSIDEYVNGWILIHILKHKFGWDMDESGFIFNMSVGYNLEGIKKDNVQRFFAAMKDSSELINNKKDKLRHLYPEIDEINIPGKISDNITLSTMHGCPPEEIEKIGYYLIKEKRLNTAIKLNPTLLGPAKLRDILNNKLGYEVEVPDIAFEHDLKYEDSIQLIKNLSKRAKQYNVEFGLKLTNTLEVRNKRGVLPEDQEMLYLSGRALHPISINVASKLQSEFDGTLDISFCAGVDCFNIKDVLECGIKPVTVCSDILKPGGYTRIAQYFDAIEELEISENSSDGSEKLYTYAEEVIDNPLYAAELNKYDTIKTNRELKKFDCIHAPCINTCAVHQNIPDYLYWTSKSELEKAFEVIQSTNPFPSITGSVCDHLCQSKCTRQNYDNSILIREIKRFVTEKLDGNSELKALPANGVKVAIIGAGPSGLSCAYFLALEGYSVTVYEKKKFAGGMTSDAIPSFRLADNSIERDIQKIVDLGVEIKYGVDIDSSLFQNITNENDFTYLAVGAQKSKKLKLENEDCNGVLDQLEFLSMVRSGQKLNLGNKVAIIGGGNSAMDAARTAKRVAGENAEVTVVYRRTRKEMPADSDEIEALIFEGIKILELVAPLEIIKENGKIKKLVCQQMQLGEMDESGRRSPVPVDNEIFDLKLDSLITAIGQDVLLDFWPEERFEVNPDTLETNLRTVYAGGDAVRGASTLIKAIADGKKAAEKIIASNSEEGGKESNQNVRNFTLGDYQKLQAKRVFGQPIPETSISKRSGFDMVHPLLDEKQAVEESSRCLFCDDICNICVSVCPNRANIGYEIQPVGFEIPVIIKTADSYKLLKDKQFTISQKYQVLNIGDFCNECGNCTTFCPTSGRPWSDKPRFYISDHGLAEETSGYQLFEDKLVAKYDGKYEYLREVEECYEYENDEIIVILDKEEFAVKDVKFKQAKNGNVYLDNCAEMFFLFTALIDHALAKVVKEDK